MTNRDAASFDAQRGFALPMCLGVLMILSFSAAGIMRIIDQTAARAEMLQSAVHQQWALYSIEQQIIWKALKEQDAAKSLSSFGNTRESNDPNDLQSISWNTQSEVMKFEIPSERNFGHDNYEVKVQDMMGLLDLNIPDPDYLDFIGGLLEIPASSRRTLIGDLHTEINRYRQAQNIDVEMFRTLKVNGLAKVQDVCRIQSWASSEACENPNSLTHYFSFGGGLIANTRLSPKHLVQRLGLDTRSDDIDKLIGWERIQQREGFYDPLQSNRSGGNQFHIWIRNTTTAHVVFFKLYLDNRDQGRPYTVSERSEHGVSFAPTAH